MELVQYYTSDQPQAVKISHNCRVFKLLIKITFSFECLMQVQSISNELIFKQLQLNFES